MADDPNPSDLKVKDEDLLRETVTRYERAAEFERENRDAAMDDLRFRAGDQWTDEATRLRKGRPTLTINRTGQFVRQIVGDVRLNKPAIKVRAADGAADPKVAEIYEGLIRHIENVSDADTAYITGVDNAATCGMGHWRVKTQYSNDDAFDQDIRIKRIKNPMAVLFDPNATELTRVDANWCFVIQNVSLDEFKLLYPDALVSSFELSQRYDWLVNTDWWTEDFVRIAEYWKKVPVEKTLWLMASGKVIDASDMTAEDEAAAQAETGDEIMRKRTVNSHKIVQYIVSGAEVLSGPHEWPGRYIPIVPVWGEEIHLGEKVYRHGIVRFAKDPQRMLNYHRSANAEAIALQPKAPFIVTPEQIEGQEQYWQEANTSSRPYLLYNATANAQKPQREPPPQPNSAAIEAAQEAAQDMNATTGIYPPSLGERSNETSGKAILARERQGDVGSYLYVDNLSKAIAHTGRILVDLIPHIYDTPRVVRILGVDGTQRMVQINQETDQMGMPLPARMNDLSVGEYDIEVEAGPSFSTKRDEAAESMMNFIQAVPPAGPLIGDLIAKNMDWPGADKIAERLRKVLPPGIAEPDENDPQAQQQPPMPPGPPPIDPAIVQAVQQQQQDEAKVQAQAAKDAADRQAKLESQMLDMQAQQQKLVLDHQKDMAELALQRAELMAKVQAQEHAHIQAMAQAQPAAEPQPAGPDPMMQAMAQFDAMVQQFQQSYMAALQQNQIAMAALAEAIRAPRVVNVTGRAPNGLITEATSTLGTA